MAALNVHKEYTLSKRQYLVGALVVPFLPVLLIFALDGFVGISSTFLSYAILFASSSLGAYSYQRYKGSWELAIVYFVAAFAFSWFSLIWTSCYVFSDCI